MLYNFWQKVNSTWGHDANELALLNSPIKQRNFQSSGNDPEKVIIQAPADYYIFTLYAQVINELRSDDTQILGLWPTIFYIKQKSDILYPIRLFYSVVNSYFIRKKWSRLYKAIGVESFRYLDLVGLKIKIRFLFMSFGLWKGLRSKEDLINLSIDGIYCGDLIYDTYLRYQIKPTVSIKNPNLIYYIYKCLCTIESSQKLVRENVIAEYFSSYSTYIHHGIPVRVFLKHGITVYTSGNLQQRFKKLSTDDYFHTAAHRRYNESFQSLENQPERVSKGMQALNNKFHGVIDTSTSYMKKSAYHKAAADSDNETLNFDGVVFLHDFYDSPHIYSSMLFADFYEWVVHTLELIIRHKLNVGVKPHPNQVADSKKDIKQLQRQFPSIKWIDPHTSNLKIISSGIQFGVSLYGTVLHELAYHGINPICAGDNPHASFSFVHTPGSIAEYDSMILNFSSLRLPETYLDQVARFFYMHNIYSKEDFSVRTDITAGYNFFNGSSQMLLKIIQLYKNQVSE